MHRHMTSSNKPTLKRNQVHTNLFLQLISESERVCFANTVKTTPNWTADTIKRTNEHE